MAIRVSDSEPHAPVFRFSAVCVCLDGERDSPTSLSTSTAGFYSSSIPSGIRLCLPPKHVNPPFHAFTPFVLLLVDYGQICTPTRSLRTPSIKINSGYLLTNFLSSTSQNVTRKCHSIWKNHLPFFEHRKYIYTGSCYGNGRRSPTKRTDGHVGSTPNPAWI